MATVSLRISIPEGPGGGVIKTLQFDPTTTVYDACRQIRDKISGEYNLGDGRDYGLFLADEDAKKGVWLEPGRNLEYYILRNNDTIEYRKKLRQLRVRMLDGSVKTLLVDDSQPVANLMVVICTKIGITNHDEYSLVCEDDENQENIENNKSNTGTLTLRRRKEEREKERDAKMTILRKKLRTDDEVNWIDPSKTLREQGIDETETVLLRRKYFFSDGNIDSRDPIQLNLLYVQARDAILDGTHPVTQDKACEFAGIQAQIQFGDYNENRHRPGFLDLKEFLPQSYVKVKGIEKKIFAEHKKHLDVSELDAKVLYTKTARSLKTYGVTFFLVKEKMKGKNKLVPRLLGVTKDSVLRLDEKTKEILKTWPLTTVRRWGASPNTFTLDFGDYSDQYYSVQTTEGEQIQQLIAGYIDIILKKKKAKDHFGIEGDEGSTMVEDSVSPLKATILSHQESSKIAKINHESVAKPAIYRPGAEGARPYGHGHVGGAQYTTISGQAHIAHSPPMVQQTKITNVLSEPQKALLSTLMSTRETLEQTQRYLSTPAEAPNLGHDPASIQWREVTLDTKKHNVTAHIAAMNAATAQVVTLTSCSQDEVDHNAVGAAITTIQSNLPEMTKDVKLIAALMEDNTNGERLLDATRKLCSAFTDLLKAAEPETREPRQNLLNAASRVGEASHQVLTTIGEETEENKEMQDMLLSLAKAVANTTAALVLKAKNIAATCEDQHTQNKVIGAATQCALATSQLVACAKVVASTVQSPACQAQLLAAVQEVARPVEALVAVCNEACQSEQLLSELSGAAQEVTRTLNDLLNHIQVGTRVQAQETIQETSMETIMVATDKLFASSGDTAEMVRQARILGQATAELINSIKGEASKQPDSDIQRRLWEAAKNLAEATARLVEAAKQCANTPGDTNRQQELRRAAELLREVTSVTASTPALKNRFLDRLEQVAKQAASDASQAICASKACKPPPGVQDSSTAQWLALEEDCASLQDYTTRLVESVSRLRHQPDSPAAQMALVSASEQFIQPAWQLVHSTRSTLTTLPTSNANTLAANAASQQLAASVSVLESSLGRAKAAIVGSSTTITTTITQTDSHQRASKTGSNEWGQKQFEAAIQAVEQLRQELDEIDQTEDLKPLPGETSESCSAALTSAAKSIPQGAAQLLSAAGQGAVGYAGRAASGIIGSLRDLTNASRGIAAQQPEIKHKVINSAQEVLTHSQYLFEEAQHSLQTSDGKLNPNLAVIAKDISASSNRCLNNLPGQQDVDETITSIYEMTQILTLNEYPPTTKAYGQLQQELNSAAANLNDCSTDVVTSIKSPVQLAKSSKNYGNAFGDLFGLSMEMAGQTKETEVRNQIVMSLRNISMTSSKLLQTAKMVSVDPSSPNAKNQLAAAARAVTDSINYLVDVCTSAAPGQKECDNAIRNIQSLKPLLDNPSEPINDFTYFECLETVMEKSKSLGDGMTGIANHAKKSEHEQFGEAVKGVSSSVCGLIEASVQAAYLVGISDPTSVAGRPGLVDQAQFARASQAIQSGCQSLSNPTSTQQQVLTAATNIAKHTSALCNACRTASSKTTNPVAKRHFVQSAKDVAKSTASLVKKIKTLDSDYSDINRARCAEATKPLLEAVEDLCVFASSSEFISIPAKISSKARQSQEPIVESSRRIIDGSCAMVKAAKSLALTPRDPPTWQTLANHSKDVSDSIKKLVSSIREKSPGQNECAQAIELLSSYLRSLDAVSLSTVSGQPIQQMENGLNGPQDNLARATAAANEIIDNLESVRIAGRQESQNIGHTVNQMIQYFEPLVNGCIGTSAALINSKQQIMLLDQAKTVTESALQLLFAVREAGGNPKAINIHSDIDEFSQSTRDGLRELLGTLEQLSTQSGIYTSVIDTITRAMSRLTDHRLSFVGNFNESDGYVDYQTRMVQNAKEIARLAQEVSSKATTSPNETGPLCSELSRRFGDLATDTPGAAAVCSSAEVSQRLRTTVLELGHSISALVGAVSVGAGREVVDEARVVNDKVSQVLATLQMGSRGTQACINAASTVSGIIGDLDTTIMFATAGTLQPEHAGDSFSEHREAILKTAKALVEDTKTLVAGAASSQEQLAVAAQNAVTTIVQLAEVVKVGAASLGPTSPDAQVMLMNAVRDVASALGELIHATKAASGKPISHPAMTQLKDSAKVMVTNVTSLLKTVKAVEDEHTRGTRALESTVEAISQEIRALYYPEGHKTTATPEELVRCTKAITVATAKAVAAGNSNKQEDIIQAANIGRKAISDMLIICKGAAYSCAETEELRNRTLKAGADVATQYRELLQAILQGGGQDSKHLLPPISRKMAQCVTDLVTAAELLKGSDWVDPDDPTVIAENELLGAAASIDAAAKKLASLRPRRTSIKEADESLNFDEMILEAAKSIAAATSALVKAASAAQRELIDSGKVSNRPLTSSDDGQWSEGLVSAARLVAAATHSLVESANALVQGIASEEKLISSAKQVASSTAQLLVACKVKADPDSESTRRLQIAGNAVIRSTDNLVRAAQRAIATEDERSLILNKRLVGGMTQEIDARSEVLRIERQLEEARCKLTAIRQAKYKMRGGGLSGDESTGGGNSSSGETGGGGTFDGYNNTTRYYESSRTLDRSKDSTNKNYDISYENTKYSQLTSPEKVNTLERNKNRSNNVLQSEINTLNSSVHGVDGPSYSSYDPNTSSDNSYTTYEKYSSVTSPLKSPKFDHNFSRLPESYKKYSESFTKNLTSPRKFEINKNISSSIDNQSDSSLPKFISATPKKLQSNGGSKTEVTEKYFTTSTPYKSETTTHKQFQNGGSQSQQQSSVSTYSNYEIINEPPIITDNETLEQRMCKKSVTQKIVEKRTVTMSQTKQEGTTLRSFKFEE
ncbi:talin-1 isoform X2 [Chrysoperla carnea]|uniref:talin-1 isoform X2 n=1 Tax=Chrysoperla carnea TaxID=189513 RepID=UPI001D07ECFD|nr:talin-1 isoform X2 [Chrysoperla carnea]